MAQTHSGGLLAVPVMRATVAMPERRRNYKSLSYVAAEFSRRTGRTTGGARQRIYQLREDSTLVLQAAVAAERMDFVTWFYSPLEAVVASATPVHLEMQLVESTNRCYSETSNALINLIWVRSGAAATLCYRAAFLTVQKLQRLMRAILTEYPDAFKDAP